VLIVNLPALDMTDRPTPPNESRLKLNETKRREICSILAVGGTRAMAATYVGCVTATIRTTAQRLPEFAQQLRKAELGPEITFLKSIQAAAGDVKHWRAAAWALERMFPERYARRPPDTITVEQMTEVIKTLAEIIMGEVPAKQYRRRLLARLEKLLDGKAERKKGTLCVPQQIPSAGRDLCDTATTNLKRSRSASGTYTHAPRLGETRPRDN
jgi:hypothetical protein